ncbi:oxidoreductase, partial [Escherichia coli]|nr:oxidoreductase [Escherichia coli]EAC1963310.1 oxidoreductase [Escherichia coli]
MKGKLSSVWNTTVSGVNDLM